MSEDALFGFEWLEIKLLTASLWLLRIALFLSRMDSSMMLRIVLFLWRMDYCTMLNIVFFLFFTSGTVSARLPESLAEAPSRLLFETHVGSGSVITIWIADHVPVIVIVVLVLALAVAIALEGFYMCCRKAGPPKRIAEETNPGSVGDRIVAKDFSDSNVVGKDSNPWVTYSVRELTEATENFSDSNLVGKGHFARVYRAHLGGDRIGAVKRLLKIDSTLFNKELLILLGLPPHPNLVNLLGICSEPGHQMIVFEFVANGTLFSRLHENQAVAGPLSWTARKKIASQVAEALRYLHEEKPRIIHRDVKSTNVLLENDFSAKLADFGVAKLAPKGNRSTSTTACGTFGYMDPLCLIEQTCSVKSDVYSFGVLLLELITGSKALEGTKNLVICTGPGRLGSDPMQIVDERLPDPNRDELLEMIRIVNCCLESKRRKRPTMTQVVDMIRNA